MADQQWAQPGWPAPPPGTQVTGLPPVPRPVGGERGAQYSRGRPGSVPGHAPQEIDRSAVAATGEPPGNTGLSALGRDTRQALARVRVVDTERDVQDGLDKCPHCGSTEIGYSITLRGLYCSSCRQSWNEANAVRTFGLNSPIADLRGHVLASATMDVREDLTMVTLKCQGCGAEISLRVEEALQTRCHWCRQKLSVSSQIAHGAVPDAVLPFTVSRDLAVARIADFIGRRKRWAKPYVTQGFRPENVFGVYVPYLVVDGNVCAELHGKGEVQTRRYTVKVGDSYQTRYDADVHQVDRAFDLLIDDLAVESTHRYPGAVSQATNHVVHALAPYDTQNAVAYSSNYLAGFTSQSRDLDVRDVDEDVEARFLTIARSRAVPTVMGYDRGVRWEHEGVAVRGTRWVSVLVPIWLYSYQPPDGAPETHYIAVNGRTAVTQGSVPVSQTKLWLASCIPGLMLSGAIWVIGLLVLLGMGFS